MATRRIARNAATSNGLFKRIDDLRLREVSDPRDSRWVRFVLGDVLRLLVFCLCSDGNAQRNVEDRSEQLKRSALDWLNWGEDQRLSDNAVGALVRRLSWVELGAALRRGVIAEWHRKGLKRHSLPWNVVAIDGKHLGTVSDKQLRMLLEDDPRQPASAAELRARCAAKFPWVQVQDGAGGVVGLVRSHNATLVSSDAAVTIHQRPIEGKTNEIGALPSLLKELKQYYGHTAMLQVFTLDAGNTSRATCQQIRKDMGHYYGRLTDAQGDIYHEAVQILGRRAHDKADHTFNDKARGYVMEYRVWTEPLPDGYLGWSGARQLIRVQRMLTDVKGKVTTGERYVITSMDATMATAQLALQLLRSHWRIENEIHWTSDAEWHEDSKRTPWTKHPDGLLVTAALRAMAVNITAVMRALTRYSENPDAPDEEKVWVKPTWKRIRETILLLCCEPLLDTTEFDRAAHA